MKVLRIGGRNLASLGEEFSIDFEHGALGAAGLFAISGPTGAGKSTLLDALCLALYDATPRLLKSTRSELPDTASGTVAATDPRTLLRRGAAEGWAEVDFRGGDGQRYRARWSVRRAYGKAGGALQDAALTLTRLADGVAIGRKKKETLAEITARVGLNFEQFTRAVLLAQNEFSAFLRSDESERGELLETLTGSTIYSELSRRAYERHRKEQAALQQLTLRLADQAPLAAPERAALEAQCAQAQALHAQAERERQALEQVVRWLGDDARLAASVAQAGQAVAAAEAQLAAAAPRRAHLERMEQVQPARALAADLARLTAELRALDAHAAEGRAQHAAAAAAEQSCQQALAQTELACAAAEAAQRELLPQLDQARLLDSRLDTCVAAQARAEADLAGAARALEEHEAQHRAALSQRAALLEAQAGRAAWFERHATLRPVAEQWERWQAVFAQAERASATLAQLQRECTGAAVGLDDARTALNAAEARSAHAALHAATAAAASAQASTALSALDDGTVPSQRNALDAERDDLARAGHAFRRWQAAGAALHAHARAVAATDALLTDTGARLAAAHGARPALQAALAQADKALTAARVACTESVERLRATLVEDEPCPVCGSAVHPYQARDPALHDLLATLTQQLHDCRRAHDSNEHACATLDAAAADAAHQQAALATQLDALTQELDQASSAWKAEALATRTDLDEAWFAAATAQLRARGLALAEREHQLLEARRVRDQAQEAHADAARLLGEQQQALHAAQSALAQAQADHAALADKVATQGSVHDALLRELDVALAGTAWRAAWASDAQACVAHYQEQVGHWRALLQAQATATEALTACELAAAAAQAHAAAARHGWEQATLVLREHSTALQAARTQRAALLGGRAVDIVGAQQQGLVDDARARRDAARTALAHAQLAAARALEAQHQLEAQARAATRACSAAEAALAAWLSAFNASQPDAHPPLDRAALAAALDLAPAMLATERAALDALAQACATARTVLAERQAQRAQHQHNVPHPCAHSEAHAEAHAEAYAQAHSPAHSPDSAAAALDSASTHCRTLNDTVVAHLAQLRQDDERRTATAGVLRELAVQQEVERRWARMHELIGQADGKKFRNYAQQFTLDVLLGYANHHLQQLARRYRLERVTSAAAPSLALMVRDQDMGGEVRSVNSLSGGESFLVSLALALGLASLSSNRVQVESLFIDEGFGSLDSETLRVALDALDGLQAQGRKIGVISHVQEMTERIATRILVQPTGAGLSSISVA